MAPKGVGHPVRESIVSWDLFGNDVVLYHPMSKQYYVLSGVAARMWQLADGNVSAEEIADQLTREYEVSKKDVLEDTIDTFEGLSDFGMLHFGAKGET